MKKYVLGFAFDRKKQNVLLIKKERPTWQKGFYNGLGGHIEEGEHPNIAMSREFKEECGLLVQPQDWEEFAFMKGDDWVCHCFKAFDVNIYEAKDLTDEKLNWFAVPYVPSVSTISNLPSLIFLALDVASPYRVVFDYCENREPLSA